VAAQDLEHPRGIAVAGLSQSGEDVSPLKADVAQEMIIQLAECDDVPMVPGRAGDAEEGWEEACHLRLFSYFWHYRNI
jgi:hypothetical protein